MTPSQQSLLFPFISYTASSSRFLIKDSFAFQRETLGIGKIQVLLVACPATQPSFLLTGYPPSFHPSLDSFSSTIPITCLPSDFDDILFSLAFMFLYFGGISGVRDSPKHVQLLLCV